MCETVDVSLIQRHSGTSLETLTQLQKQMVAGYGVAAEYAANLEGFPRSDSDFIETLLTLHRHVFSVAEPSIAGRFRIERERVWYGTGANQREGLPPRVITDELARLHKRVPIGAQALTPLDVARHAGRFLERFFVIHPFVDGNGRVARLMVDLFARSAGTCSFREETTSAKERRMYVEALRYAHRHAPENDDPQRVPGRDPHAPLARWIVRRLVDRSHLEDDFVPPEEIAKSKSRDRSRA